MKPLWRRRDSHCVTPIQVIKTEIKGPEHRGATSSHCQRLTFADEKLHCTQMSRPRGLHQGRTPPFRLVFLQDRGGEECY